MAFILVAEDDEQIRGYLAAGLRRAGHYVEAVADGLEALDACRKSAFDLLLADVVMPGMDGIELARRVGEVHPAIKIMFITGFAAVAIKSTPVATGNARVLSKPFHLRELIVQVESLLAS